MNAVLAASVYVIHTVANASNTINPSRQAGPTSLSVSLIELWLSLLYT